VVVIVILGVVSCGAGVIRGRMDAAGPPPTPSARFEGFGDSAVPSRDVTTDQNGGCTRNDPVITVSGTCVLTVDPQSLRPRSLRLLPTSGTVVVVVTQSIRGETKASDPDSLSTGEAAAKISVAGTSPVNVILSCVSSCQVQILG
jgi:hypothetical protein